MTDTTTTLPRRVKQRATKEANRQAWQEVQAVWRSHRDNLRNSALDALEGAMVDGGMELLTTTPSPGDVPLSQRRNFWQTRRLSGKLNRQFKEFILHLLRVRELNASSAETLDLVEKFLARPTGNNRLKLYSRLKRSGELRPERVVEMAEYMWYVREGSRRATPRATTA